MSDSLQPMNCSLPGSSIRGILQARILEWVAMPFSRGYSLVRGIFPTLGSNPGLLHCWQILYHLSHQESPKLKKKKCVYDIRKALVNSRLLVVKFWEIKSWSGTSDCPGWGGELAPQFSYFLRVNCIFHPFHSTSTEWKRNFMFQTSMLNCQEWKERN